MSVTIPATGPGAVTPVVATEAISATHFQQFKLIDGNVGSLDPVGTSANPINIQQRGISTITGSMAVTQVGGPWTMVGTANVRGVIANSAIVSSAEPPLLFGGVALPSPSLPPSVGSFSIVQGLFDLSGRPRVFVDAGSVNVVGIFTGSVQITANSGIVVEGDTSAGSFDDPASNPVKIGGYAVTSSFPAAVGSGTRVNALFDRTGRQVQALWAPLTLSQNKHNDFTGPASGSVVWSAGVANRICVTDLRVMAGSATGGIVSIFFARSGAPIQFTVGSGTCLFRGEMAPSTTVKPGAVMMFPYPVVGDANDALRISITTTMQIYVQAGGFEAP